jgi:C-terminal processing protease CtpA/Prc
MLSRIPWRTIIALLLVTAWARPVDGAEQKLGFTVSVEGGGFFLNPVVTKILVSEVDKGSIAELAGMRTGDEIIQIDGKNIAGRRALELRGYMKLNPGETRLLHLKHADGTEADARITKPKG